MPYFVTSQAQATTGKNVNGALLGIRLKMGFIQVIVMYRLGYCGIIPALPFAHFSCVLLILVFTASHSIPLRVDALSSIILPFPVGSLYMAT